MLRITLGIRWTPCIISPVLQQCLKTSACYYVESNNFDLVLFLGNAFVPR